MKKLLSIIVCLLMVSAGVASATMNGDEKKQEQTTEKKEEKKDEKKDDDKDEGKGKPRKPILIVVYEFAWPWIMR